MAQVSECVFVAYLAPSASETFKHVHSAKESVGPKVKSSVTGPVKKTCPEWTEADMKGKTQ